MSGALAGRLKPCGPVTSPAAAERSFEGLSAAADEGGWRLLLDQAWPALEPAFSASPYLSGIARRWPERLRLTLASQESTVLAEDRPWQFDTVWDEHLDGKVIGAQRATLDLKGSGIQSGDTQLGST